MKLTKDYYEQAWGKYNPMAQTYFASKKLRRFYNLHVIADNDFDLYWYLSDEQVSLLRDHIDYFLKQNPDVKEIEPDEMREIIEEANLFSAVDWMQIQDISNSYNYGHGEVVCIDGIDLDHPKTCYRFGLVYLNDFFDEPCRSRINVSMSDEQYVRLLTYMLIERSLRVQDLKGVDDDLYNCIISSLEYNEETIFHSYMVLMPEVNEDAEAILGEKYYSDAWTVTEENYSETVWLTLNEKMLMIQGLAYKDNTVHQQCTFPDIYFVPVADMLGVRSYADLCKALNEKFGHVGGLKEIVAWCRENGWLSSVDNSK